MSNIEDDINELKSIMNLRTESGFAYSQKNTLLLQKSIKNILSDYTRQKQINEKHQRINGELREKVKELEEENALQRRQLNSAFDNGYIHADKIRKLIASETINISGFECIAVRVLQELLEGESK